MNLIQVFFWLCTIWRLLPVRNVKIFDIPKKVTPHFICHVIVYIPISRSSTYILPESRFCLASQYICCELNLKIIPKYLCQCTCWSSLQTEDTEEYKLEGMLCRAFAEYCSLKNLYFCDRKTCFRTIVSDPSTIHDCDKFI